MECGISLRPIRSGSVHPNGKVERFRKTDKLELYAPQDLDDPELPDRLSE